MHLFLKRAIILLLFMLQGLSPLVHAHVESSEGMETGIHIDGFSVYSDQSAHLSKLEAIGHSDAVIGMSSAIQQKRLLDTESPATFADLYQSIPLKLLTLEYTVGFSPHLVQLKSPSCLSPSAPRAPPVV